MSVTIEMHTSTYCFCFVNGTQPILDHVVPPVRNGLSLCSECPDPDRDGLDTEVNTVAPIVDGRISWIAIWSIRVKQRKSCSPGPNSERKKQLVLKDDIILQHRLVPYADDVVQFQKLNVFFSCFSTLSPKPRPLAFFCPDTVPVIISAPPPPTQPNQTILIGDDPT